MILELLPWIISGVSIIGATYNAFGRRVGFYIWLVANFAWIAQCILIKNYGQIPMWIFYSGTCILGLFWWKRKGVGK